MLKWHSLLKSATRQDLGKHKLPPSVALSHRLRQSRRKSANLQNNLDLPKTHLLNSHWSEPVTRCGARSTLWHRGCGGWNVWFDYIVWTVLPLSSDWSVEPILASDWLTRAPCLALSIGQCKCQLPPSLISLIASSEVTTISEESSADWRRGIFN